ncbi:MAG: AAA family ATPase [Burkholderiales bacterium]|nr:AAA family ATPase [Burkholderiales bacterium]
MNDIAFQPRITSAALAEIAQTAAARVAQVRSIAVSPGERKRAPTFSIPQLLALTGLDRNQFNYRAGKGELPQGTVPHQGRREFALSEVRTWVAACLNAARRPAGVDACVIATVSFKGGSTKTSTTMALAQGLSLRGHAKVLVVDLDPQGTLTQFFSILPDTEVDDERTVGPLCFGDGEVIAPTAPLSTYWDGIDLIPASPALFGAEFALPARQVREPAFEFWNVLNRGLRDLRREYDFILIDTSPSLSYLTINALYAADGLLVPLPPDNPAYSSLAQFWNLFADIANGIDKKLKAAKEYDFLHILLSRVDSAKPATSVVRKWIAATYADYLLPVEIPETSVAHTTAVKYQTVYDVTRYSGSERTYKRAREAYDRMVELVEQSASIAWARMAGEGRAQ